MAAIGPRGSQQSDKDRPYWIWIWQGDISGGGNFGGGGGWQKFNSGSPTGPIDLSNNNAGGRNQSRRRCVLNCTPTQGTERKDPVFETVEENVDTPIPDNQGRPPIVEAFTPAGLPGETGAITSFFPPITVDIDCQQSPLRIEGGQIETIYDLTISARGYLRDFVTDEIIIPFNVSTVVRGPGPIVGYTVSQYSFGTGQRDLRANVYYSDENNNIGDFKKDFQLSMQTITGGQNNMTLEGLNYYFDVLEVTLDNLTRTDGLSDNCGTTACTADIEFTYELTDNPGVVITDTIDVDPPVPWIIRRVAIVGTPGTTGNQIFVYGDNEPTQNQLIFTAFTGGGPLPGEVLLTAAFTDISCDYTVNSQLPGCFIETPETCNVTIRDQQGILLDQTYFGRPTIDVSSEYS